MRCFILSFDLWMLLWMLFLSCSLSFFKMFFYKTCVRVFFVVNQTIDFSYGTLILTSRCGQSIMNEKLTMIVLMK